MAKYRSMLNPAQSSAKRLYSPQHDIRFKPAENAKPFVIGICGGPSSGKSTVAKLIKKKLPNAAILNLIHFYKPIRGNLRRRSRASSMIEDQKNIDEIKSDIRDKYRKNDFDTPDAIDWALLNKGVDALKKGQPFNKPIYDERVMMRMEKTEHVKPTSVIIIEGHLIFCNEELMKKMDLKVFVDTDDDVRLSRRVLKMSKQYPNDMTFLSDLLQKYEEFIKPSFEKYVEPTKKYSDIILPNYGFSTEDKLEIDHMNIPAIELIIKRV